MPPTEEQVEALASAAYETTRREGGSRLPRWADLDEETKEGFRQIYRDPEPAIIGVPSRLYVGASRPTAPDMPAVWIPLDEDGSPLPVTSWEVFV